MDKSSQSEILKRIAQVCLQRGEMALKAIDNNEIDSGLSVLNNRKKSILNLHAQLELCNTKDAETQSILEQVYLQNQALEKKLSSLKETMRSRLKKSHVYTKNIGKYKSCQNEPIRFRKQG